MPRSSSQSLSRRLALASVGTALAVVVVCAVGLFSLGDAAAVARVTVTRQMQLADDATAMSAFLYQKGFVAEYLLTGDRDWLTELETARPAFESWLGHAHHNVTDATGARLLDQIQTEYASYDAARKRAIALFDGGDAAGAKAALGTDRPRARHLRALFEELGGRARADAERNLVASERRVRRLARLLVATSVAGAAASVLVGFLWARRVTKPIYALEVQVGAAAERTRINVAPGRAGLDALGDQVSALVAKLEQTDAALAEHRRRLIQSEKLSAVGELAAKLAHEVLNPLAGIKAAVQVLARHKPDSGRDDVAEVTEAVSREITRVDGLLRRLMRFARPLAPRVEIVTVASIVDAAIFTARPALERAGVTVQRVEAADLPPLEADPQLLTQAVTNLLSNAADAMAAGGGGAITVEVGRATSLGREEIFVRVADRGPGIPDAVLTELFKPFFTTKAEGHGLGLAVSQNILLEHGGRITAANRTIDDGPGAVFEVSLPVVR